MPPAGQQEAEALRRPHWTAGTTSLDLLPCRLGRKVKLSKVFKNGILQNFRILEMAWEGLLGPACHPWELPVEYPTEQTPSGRAPPYPVHSREQLTGIVIGR